MNKTKLISELKKINPLRTMQSWNRSTLKELQTLYDEAKKLGAL